MRKVKGENTSPEITIRKMLRALGDSGYRLHRKDLPGKPDIVFVCRKLAMFVHGCFWHGHDCKRGARIPKTNRKYWQKKINRNKKRDTENIAKLQAKSWKVLVVWECELGNREIVSRRLKKFLKS
jgi:DNA mismatch endonuclease (patch repair protein)